MYFNRKNAEQKNWRMIKKGKHFLFGCSLVFAVGATLATPTVHADTAEAKAEVTAGTTQAKPSAEVLTYASPAVTSPAETAPVEANSVTTVVSADKSQLEAVLAQAKTKNLEGQEASVKAEVAAAIAEAEVLVANGTASQEQVNQSVERLNQAVASVKEVTEATVETTTEAASEETTDSSETPKVRNKRATSEGTSRSVDETRLDRVTVTKDNFDSFFKEGGTANYDETSGTIKLTDDVSGQVGSAYLRFKIDPREDFTFTGKVDIGDKYEGHTVGSRPGGDGVGFVFHTGNVDTIGQSGASIGMGTIKNAFGFKLDSWHNTSNPNANQNASADPRYGNGRKINGKFEWEQNAFGSFYSSNNAGRVTTSSSAAKALNPKPNGEWVDFKIEYKGQSKEFIVTYGSEKWSTNLKTANASIMEPTAKTALNNSNATYALSFLGSTGSGTNLQRVQIEKFEFTAPQIVQVAFYDEAGHELAASSAIPGDRDQVVNLSNIEAVQKAITKIKAKGYTLKEVNSEKAETYNAGANTVTLRSGGQLLKYVFAVKDTTPPAAPTVNSVTAGATAVTGTAEAGSTVEVTLPNGSTVSAKADQDGSYSVPVSGLKEGDTLSVTATDDAGNKSTPTSVTVPDTTAPAAPTVNPVKAGATAVTGTAEAGSTVEVTLPGGAKKSATAGEDGTFSIPVSGLNENDEVSVTATDAANNTSAPTTATVGKADANGAKAPEAKTPVKDPANLTEEEKIQVAEEILKANPTLADVDVANDGTATVTFPDGSKATLTPAQTVVKAEEKAKDADGLKAPETKTPVKDTANLTDDEKAAVKKAVEAANPGSVAEVGQDGTTKVTFPDGSTATLSGDKTVKAADANGLKEPAAKTPVKDTANLTDAEKAAVKKAVEAANPGSKAEVGQDGTTKVTFPDGSTATLTGDQTVKTADSNGVQAPSTKTPVKDTANLTDAEKAKVKEAVEAANPGSKAEVGQDGTTTVTFPDGSTATLTGDQTVKTADSNGIQAPSSKTPVKDTANLTDAEKAKVKEAVEAANPGSKAEVGQDGTTKVTFPDGSTATLTGDQTVKTADSNGVQAPSTKTPVKDTANLTDVEKAKVKEAVEAANPGSKAEVGQDGSTKVTFPDGSTATLTGDKTVTKADITAPTAPVVNPVKAGDTAVTGTAEAGSTVEVILPDGSKVSAKADKDGKFSVPVSGLHAGDTVSVTATDESGNTSATTTVTVSNVNVGGKDADNAKVPVLTPVVDPNNLTDAEKAKVAEEVKKANPTATDVKVNNDGSVVVTFADGSVATIAANKVVKEATKESSAQAPAKKAGAKELPNTGTKQSNASLGLALLAAVTGGLLISKKRKEEE